MDFGFLLVTCVLCLSFPLLLVSIAEVGSRVYDVRYVQMTNNCDDDDDDDD